MESRVHRLRIGSFRLVHPLEPGPLAGRWLSLNERDESTHVVHQFGGRGHDRIDLRRLVESVERLAPLSHPHILPIEQFTLDRGSGRVPDSAWIVTPYTGTPEGLVTLSLLRADKGGQMTPMETDRALVQLLEASEFAHANGFQHGPIIPDEILVDRRGSLSVELYGLRRHLGAPGLPVSELERDEVRSIVEIGYTLLTGLSAEEPRIAASRLFPRLDHRWDDWFDRGLDATSGFLSAGEALAALPSLRREVEVRTSPVRTVLGTFKRVLGAT